MHRLRMTTNLRIGSVVLGFVFCFVACAPKNPIVRDQLVVEKLRLRITKVRNAVAETRAVIAASRGAPYLPEIYMRLAELMSEEARYHYMVAYEREQRRTKSLHVPQVRFLKEQAIGTYNSILKRYPDTHLADRILFNISHEQRELGMFDEMKETLERLVKEHKDSPYRTEALLVLGDFHFDRTEFVKAENYFKEISGQKEGPLLGLAYYKLAWVDVNMSNCKKALKHFEKAIYAARNLTEDSIDEVEDLTAKKEEKVRDEFEIPISSDQKYSYAGHKSLNVQREALVDLTYCYAQERKPEKAVAYLRDHAPSREAYVAALGKLANRYAIIEQPKGAADVARELLRLAPDDEERLDDARLLHSAVTRMKDYSVVGGDVYLVLRAMRRQQLRPNLDAAASEMLDNEFEMIARDLATKAHGMLQNPSDGATRGKGLRKSKGSEWTAKPATPEETADAYEAYLTAIPDSSHRLEVVQNLSDVLMDGKQFLEAGHRYRETAQLISDEIVALKEGKKEDDKDSKKGGKDKAKEKINPKQKESMLKKDRRDALYNSVVAYQSSLDSEGSRGHLERAAARAGLRKAGWLCLADGLPDKEKSKKIKFAIAQSYYDEGRYLEAIDLLTAVAYEFAKTPQGDAAVHMVLDSYSTINDVGGLINVGRRFMTKGSPINEGVKAQIGPIVTAAEQRRLDELSLAASGDQAGGMEILLAFADRYKSSNLGERAMLSAFVAARAGGDTSQLYSLGEQVVKHFPKSEQAGGVVSTMGRTAAARFEFDRAIEYLERAAEMTPDQKSALLLTAGEIRQQLADKSGALKDYRAALAAAGEGPGRAAAAAHLADLIEREDSPAKVVSALKPLADPPDPEISSRLGLALLRTGKHEEAEEYLRSVVEGASAATVAAQARANYGMAEIMLHMLESFDPPPELDAIEEAIGLVDLVLQSYLAAARQPDPIYSQAALARLARAAVVGAEKMEQIKLPREITQEERALIKEAMASRAAALRSDSKEALAECARRAKTTYLLNETGRACVKGVPPVKDSVRFHSLSTRKKVGSLKKSEEARDRLSRNPDDLDALREVGTAFLDAGDPHAARLVLGRTVEAGGGADDLNLLGVASYEAGDTAGALEAFGRAKDAGSGAAALNLAAMCKEMGLGDFAKEILKGAPSETKGRLLSKARSLKGGGK
ncbi:MAG: tetratricopeptide repeat protein [Deltaproteobacteria bacterium]|nr:tetratricopeptide repeat protein [Deltaproteobacteria bacterium]